MLDTPSQVFAVERRGRTAAARVYVNLSAETIPMSVERGWRDDRAGAPAELAPYAVAWLAA